MKIVTAEEAGVDVEGYALVGMLPDGRVCAIHQLAYHWTMHLDLQPDGGHEGRYCFETLGKALVAFTTWEGEGDPPGWHKHYPTRQCPSFPYTRCHDPETGEIWKDTEPSPKSLRAAAAGRKPKITVTYPGAPSPA